MVLCSGVELFKLEVNVKMGQSTLFLTPIGVIRLLLFKENEQLSLPLKTTKVKVLRISQQTTGNIIQQNSVNPTRM